MVANSGSGLGRCLSSKAVATARIHLHSSTKAIRYSVLHSRRPSVSALDARQLSLLIPFIATRGKASLRKRSVGYAVQLGRRLGLSNAARDVSMTLAIATCARITDFRPRGNWTGLTKVCELGLDPRHAFPVCRHWRRAGVLSSDDRIQSRKDNHPCPVLTFAFGRSSGRRHDVLQSQQNMGLQARLTSPGVGRRK